MKYIKKFENIELSKSPEIGDYVIINKVDLTHYFGNDAIFYNVLGVVINKFYHRIGVEYKINNRNFRYTYNINNILFCSKNIKDAELYLQSNKYGL